MMNQKTRKREDGKTGLPTRLPAHPSSRLLPRRDFLWTGLLFIPTLARAQFIQSAGYQAAVLGLPPAGGGACGGTTKDSQTGVTNNFADNQSYAWGAYNFTAGSSYTLCKLTLRLAKVGTPAGNVLAAIYTNSGSNLPGTQVGTASDAVAATTLATSEGNIDLSNLSASVTSATVYWIVVKTTQGTGANNVKFVFYNFDGVASHHIKLSNDSGGSWDEWTDSNQGKFTSYA